MAPLRLDRDKRRKVILDAALIVARDEGLHNVTFAKVAEKCAIETSKYTVKHWFQTRDGLWRATVTHDRTGDLRTEAETLGLHV